MLPFIFRCARHTVGLQHPALAMSVRSTASSIKPLAGLNEAERTELLKCLKEWKYANDGVRDTISKSVHFADFNEAFGFMTR